MLFILYFIIYIYIYIYIYFLNINKTHADYLLTQTCTDDDIFINKTLQSNIFYNRSFRYTYYYCNNKSIIGIEGESSFTNNYNTSNLYLVYFNMNNNSIRSIDQLLIKLPALQYLHMNNNLIIKLGYNTFKFNTKLEAIHLLNNKIQIFNLDLVNLKSLMWVYISFNLLTTIKERAFHILTGRTTILLVYDIVCKRLTCSCESNWIIHIMFENRKRRVYVGTPCFNKNQQLKRLQRRNLSTGFQYSIYEKCRALNLNHCKKG